MPEWFNKLEKQQTEIKVEAGVEPFDWAEYRRKTSDTTDRVFDGLEPEVRKFLEGHSDQEKKDKFTTIFQNKFNHSLTYLFKALPTMFTYTYVVMTNPETFAEDLKLLSGESWFMEALLGKGYADDDWIEETQSGLISKVDDLIDSCKKKLSDSMKWFEERPVFMVTGIVVATLGFVVFMVSFAKTFFFPKKKNIQQNQDQYVQ